MKARKVIISILICSLIIGIVSPIPVNAETTEKSYIEVIRDCAPLRSGPGKSYEKVIDLQIGDCLVYTGFTENKYGNVWYFCEFAGSDE